MRVILAYALDKHKAGDTVDLPTSDARNLLSEGRARKAPESTPAKPKSTEKKEGA